MNTDEEYADKKSSGVKMKTSFYFSQYFNGKRGLRLYEFHNGKVSLVEHDGENWKHIKELKVCE